MKNRERCNEISSKIIKMSEALIKEGEENGETAISDLGTMLSILGAAFLIEKEREFLVDIFDMYSAKQVLLAMNRGDFGGLTEEGYNPDAPISNE